MLSLITLGDVGAHSLTFLLLIFSLSITHVLLIALILSYIYIIITTHSLTIHSHVFSNVTYSLPFTYVYLRGSNPYLVTGFSLLLYLRHTPMQSSTHRGGSIKILPRYLTVCYHVGFALLNANILLEER